MRYDLPHNEGLGERSSSISPRSHTNQRLAEGKGLSFLLVHCNFVGRDQIRKKTNKKNTGDNREKTTGKGKRETKPFSDQATRATTKQHQPKRRRRGLRGKIMGPHGKLMDLIENEGSALSLKVSVSTPAENSLCQRGIHIVCRGKPRKQRQQLQQFCVSRIIKPREDRNAVPGLKAKGLRTVVNDDCLF